MAGGERRTIEMMAEVLSEPLFSELGWESSGPQNLNFPCEEQERHGDGKQHPLDVVFHYKDPYSGRHVYLNTDLKSYSATTLQGTDLKKILRSLSMSVDCANQVKEWHDRYVATDEDWIAEGLLFIYNHDGESDRDFPKLMTELKASDPGLGPGKRAYILYPEKVTYLATVVNDIQKSRGAARNSSAELPGPEKCFYYYPDLEGKKVSKTMFSNVATIELLLQRRLIIRYDWGNGGRKGYVIYDSGKGDSQECFVYLLDFIFQEKMLRDSDSVQICLPAGVEGAKAFFEKAKKLYAESSWAVEEDLNKEQFKDRLELIQFRPITHIVTKFSKVTLGF